MLQSHICLLLQRPKGLHVTLLTEVLQAQFNNLSFAQRIVVLHARTCVHGIVLAMELNIPDTEIEGWSPRQQWHDFQVEYGQILSAILSHAAQFEYFRYIIVFKTTANNHFHIRLSICTGAMVTYASSSSTMCSSSNPP